MRTPPTPVSVLVAARVLPCFTVGRARSAWEALMRRREFIALIGGVAAWPLSSANAQARVRRMVFLASTPAAEILDLQGAFREALREHGYREGQNITLEFPWPQGLPEEAELSTALPRLKVDLILAWGTPAVMAARGATSTLPIIMVGVADPVGSGVVASLARPGGNVTGISNLSRDLSGKLLELLLEAVPNADRVAVLRNPTNPSSALQLQETESAARSIGLPLHLVEPIGRCWTSLRRRRRRLAWHGV